MRARVTYDPSTIRLLVCLGYIAAFFFSDRSSAASLLRVLLGLSILLYFSGASLSSFLRQVWKTPDQANIFSTGALTLDLLLSFLVLVTVSTVLTLSFALYEYVLVGTITGLVIALSIFSLGNSIRKVLTRELEVERGKFRVGLIMPFVIIGVSSAFFGAFFRSVTPFPSLSGWDMHSALAYVNWILSHHGYGYVLIPPFPSALVGYPAVFFFLVSSFSLFLGMSPFSVYWYSVYLLIFSYMSLVYQIALGLSKNPYLSLTSSFVAFFAGTGFAEVVRSPLYLTLDMVGQLFFLLILVFQMSHRGTWKKAISMLAIAYLAIFNFFTVIAIFPFLLSISLQERRLPLLGSGRGMFRFATILMGIFVPVLMYTGSVLNPAVAAYLSPPDGAFPIELKVAGFVAIYSPYFLLLFALSITAMTVRHFWVGRKQSDYFDILLYVGVAFVIYFQPAYITYRIEFYARVFMATSVSGLIPFEAK